jgi:hypothetical protein
VADDWRVRVELRDERTRRQFTELLQDGLSPLGADLAQALDGGHLSISGDDENLFVYTDTSPQAENAHAVILSELEHHGITATTSGVEHWLADEERWDNEPSDEDWEEEVERKGYAPWEVRVTCRSRHEAMKLEQQLEDEGYRPIRQWKHLIIGTESREDADALALRLDGEVETGGAVVWEEALDSKVVRPFVFFG